MSSDVIQSAGIDPGPATPMQDGENEELGRFRRVHAVGYGLDVDEDRNQGRRSAAETGRVGSSQWFG